MTRPCSPCARCPASTRPPASRRRLAPAPSRPSPSPPAAASNPALCCTATPAPSGPCAWPPCQDGRRLLAAAGNDVWAWDLAAVDATAPGARPPVPVTGPLTGHDGWIWSLVAIPAGSGSPSRLASASADHTVRLWDPVSGRALGQPLTGHTDQVRAVITAASDDGRLLLVSGGHDGTIRLWDPVTGTPGAVIPLGIPVHALLAQRPDPASRQRTSGGATITAGLRTGILTLDLHRTLFRSALATSARTPAPPSHRAS